MGKHTEWRKIAKKARRKRIRKQLAQERCALEKEEQRKRENSPNYLQWLEEQRLLEEHQQQEEVLLAQENNKRWIEAEKRAQEEWQILQAKLKLIKEERAKHQALIKVEWEKEQRKLKQLEEQKMKEQEEKDRQQLILNEQLKNFLENGGKVPEYLNRILETNPNKPICQFFKKIGACRFGDACSRNHQRPCISTVLLIPNFYSHISLQQSMENEYGSDSLEFESHERYSHFKEFFYDVLPELEKYGHIKQFKVCCNEEAHLRGNVYVQYSNFREAMSAYRIFHGRWYGGKRLNVQFCGIESWKNAICGLFFKNACPKGSACNFLHVFRNPGNLYNHSDKDPQSLANYNQENESSSRNWRWSESPERPYKVSPKNRKSKQKHKDKDVRHKSRKHKRSRSSSRHSRSPHNRSRRKTHKKTNK